MSNDNAKRAAGQAAARLVKNNTIVGLGTGSTAARFVEALAARVASEKLTIRCVPTSRAAEVQAAQLGLPTVPLTSATLPDLTIDGADEVDPAFHLIKGAGGALVQEKLVAVSSHEMVVVVDPTKVVATLGAFSLPAAVIPFGWETTHARLTSAFPGVPAVLRVQGDGKPVVTDDGLLIIDLAFGATIADPEALQAKLRTIVGVAEVGLFVGIATTVVIGHDDGTAEIRTKP